MPASKPAAGGSTLPGLDLGMPDDVTLVAADQVERACRQGEAFSTSEVLVATTRIGQAVEVHVDAPRTALSWIRLRWHRPLGTALRVLGDAWERAYGDLEWRGMVPDRVLPFYCLLWDGRRTFACGLRTGGNALGWWQVDPQGLSLVLDVRCGGSGVLLGSRRLHAATIV